MIPRRTILFFAMAAALGAPLYGQTSLGELSATDASVSGAVIMTAGDTRIMSGSLVTTGQAAASLRLARGGEVRICPGASLSVTASPGGNQLMLALGTGAIETHYRLSGFADTILTPDFRILLAGPGDFHFAVASDARGDTCIRSLPANTASVIVNELLGDGVYQVSPGGQVFFHGGRVDAATVPPPDCGCPPPPPKAPAERLSESGPLKLAAPSGAAGPPQPVPADSPAEVHVTVEAPFVFRGTEPEPSVDPPPAVARLTLETLPAFSVAIPRAAPPAPAPPTEIKHPVEDKAVSKAPAQKGFLGHLRSFFGAIFH